MHLLVPFSLLLISSLPTILADQHPGRSHRHADRPHRSSRQAPPVPVSPSELLHLAHDALTVLLPPASDSDSKAKAKTAPAPSKKPKSIKPKKSKSKGKKKVPTAAAEAAARKAEAARKAGAAAAAKKKKQPKAKVVPKKLSKARKEAVTIPLTNRSPSGSDASTSVKIAALRKQVHGLKAKTIHNLASYQSHHSNHPLLSHGAITFSRSQIKEAMTFGEGLDKLVKEVQKGFRELVAGALADQVEGLLDGHGRVKRSDEAKEGEELVGPDYPTWKKRTEGAVGKRGMDDEDLRALWTGELLIGSPPQKFNLNFDTGSADAWVIASQCTSKGCAGKNKFATTGSKTEIKQKGTLDVLYGDGTTASGPIFLDTIAAGSVSTKAYFGAMTKATDSFNEDPSDGIVGMAFGSLSIMEKPTFFESLWKSRAIPYNIFSFRLSSGANSYLTLGGVNKAHFKGRIAWSKILDPSFWTIRGSINVAGQKAVSAKMMIDTGTSLVLAPPEDAKALYSKIPGSKQCPENVCGEEGFWTIPCSSTSTISFTFGGRAFPVAASDFSAGKIGADVCVGALIGQDYGMSAWIVGDTFLKSVYAIFDMAGKRVGFAEPV